MSLGFDGFAAIDWSGARGTRHRSIAVAIAWPGRAAPHIVRPPNPRGWARDEVRSWIAGLSGRWLVGLDFSFAPPWRPEGYFPGLAAPDNGPALWHWIDALAEDEPDLGAAGLVDGALAGHFWRGARDGPKAAAMRLRATEARFNALGGGKPSSIFDCVGAAQVGKASLAGMRLLARLASAGLAIWPFTAHGQGTVLVEIYTRLFLRLAGGRGTKLRSMRAVHGALALLDGAPDSAGHDRPIPDHAADALVAAAGLRRLAGSPLAWAPPGLDPELARREGWTFGVT